MNNKQIGSLDAGTIHRTLANYISTFLSDPSLFNKSISDEEKYKSFEKYLSQCDMDELGFILYDIISTDFKVLTSLNI